VTDRHTFRNALVRRKVVSSANRDYWDFVKDIKGQDRHRQVFETQVKVTHRPLFQSASDRPLLFINYIIYALGLVCSACKYECITTFTFKITECWLKWCIGFWLIWVTRTKSVGLDIVFATLVLNVLSCSVSPCASFRQPDPYKNCALHTMNLPSSKVGSTYCYGQLAFLIFDL